MMSGLTVRSYVKMAFDTGSYQKTQQDYNAALARLQNDGLRTVGQANAQLKQQHANFVKDLQRQNRAAEAELVAQNKITSDKIAAQSKKAANARIPGMNQVKFRKDGAVAQYKWNVKKYEEALNKMKLANASYVASARALGGRAAVTSSGMLDAGVFASNDAPMRKRLIIAQAHRVETKKGTEEYIRQKIILEDMWAVHKGLLTNEQVRNGVIATNTKLEQMSLSNLRRALAQNNAFYREQLQLQMQINMSLQRMKMNLQQGLVGALMVSAIALMTFGFRLQGVVDTFKEFEKELMNAQSIFQTTDKILYDLSDQIVEFGTRYGIALTDASEGLYTLASAGLSASESQEVLQNTLKLSMAVQGDHETVAKLTTQTIFGFGLEMSDSAELTDKFAHAINKSLIEYQDLASAVKFAMPFFITTGQNIDQLLGSLEILTNRALEAGIAGRGLRQALAEFAQHADDNTAAFAKLGIKVTDSQGNFLMLTEIAKNFQTQMGEMVNDTELLTTLLEDLNVRGATAFVHLVQNADEFQHAVDDLANSSGSATAMAEIQQQSLANQIQVVKNTLMAPFLLSDKIGAANGTMNEFAVTLHDMVANFEVFFIKTMPNGTRILTEQGIAVRDIVIAALDELSDLMSRLLVAFSSMNGEGTAFKNILHALFLPIRTIVKIFGVFGEGLVEAIMLFKTMNMILPVTSLRTTALTMATEGHMLTQLQSNLATTAGVDLSKKMSLAKFQEGVQINRNIVANRKQMLTYAQSNMMMAASNVALFAGFMLMQRGEPIVRALGIAMVLLAGAMMGVALASALIRETMDPTAVSRYLAGAALGGAAIMGLTSYVLQSAMTPPEDLGGSIGSTYDMGGRIYDTGGLGGRHFPVMVEPGETITSKTQNMLGGGGITLNIGGDIVTNDADDFANRIAEALPIALRQQSDIGGI